MGLGYTKSFKNFLSKHPPLLVFITCLVIFGLAAIILAALVGEKELPNPDIETDWNTFLSNLAQWDVCRQHANKMKSRKHVIFDTLSENVMVQMIMSWKSSKHGAGIATAVSGSLRGTPEKDNDFLHVTMHFPNLALYNNSCVTELCTVTVPVCLTFTGSLNMLPNTRKPRRCSEKFNLLTNDDVLYEASVSSLSCAEDDLLQTSYVTNPDLTVMLTYRERSIVNVHLMHTGYFILLVALTLFCSILLRDHFKSSAHNENKVLSEEILLGSKQSGV